MFHNVFMGDAAETDGMPIEVTPAGIQGFEANALHFAAKPAARNIKSRPLFLRQLPLNVLEAIAISGVCSVDVDVKMNLAHAPAEAKPPPTQDHDRLESSIGAPFWIW